MTTYIDLPLTGASPYWGNAVNTSANLPAQGPVDGAVIFVIDTRSLWAWDQTGGLWHEVVNGLADVSGPASSTDEAFARFDGTSGKVIQNSAVTADNSGNILTAGSVTAGSLSTAGALDAGSATIGTLSGPVKGTAGALSASAIDLDSAEVTGVLPVANGGTNSLTALNNNRVMQSSGGAVVEAAAITASRALESDANGIPVASVTTATELGYLSGVTSAIQTQIDSKVTGPATATDEAIARYDGTTGELIQDSSATIDNSGNIATTARINAGTAKLGATGAAATSAVLELAGTTGALLLTRLTAAERDALTATNGMIIYLSDTDRFQGYFAGAWADLHGWGS